MKNIFKNIWNQSEKDFNYIREICEFGEEILTDMGAVKCNAVGIYKKCVDPTWF